MKNVRFNNHIVLVSCLLTVVLTGCNSNLTFDSYSLGKASTPSIEPVVTPPPAPPQEGNRITERTYVAKFEKAVDILIITDNSGSMAEEQRRASESFNSFIQDLSAINWQIGVTTTDVTSNSGLHGELSNFDGTSLKMIDKSTPNAESLFRNTIRREERGSSNEEPLKAAIKAMEKRNSENQGFFRDHADLAIVILSDEDEMSDGLDSNATQPQDVLDAFSNIWGNRKQIKVYGLVIKPGDEACFREQEGGDGAAYGDFADQLASMTGGITGSICQNDYSSSLRSIGSSIESMFRSYTLSNTPKVNSLEIKMTPTQNISWSLSGKVVTFGSSVPAETSIEFIYKNDDNN